MTAQVTGESDGCGIRPIVKIRDVEGVRRRGELRMVERYLHKTTGKDVCSSLITILGW